MGFQVTLAMAVFRGFSWKKVPGYFIGQLFGAWLGALLVYANYFHAIDIFEGGKGIRTTPGTASFFGVYTVSVRFSGESESAELIIFLLSLTISPPPMPSSTRFVIHASVASHV